MRYLSICSGIEAASVAWNPLGWTPAGFAEIEPFPRAVLEQRHGAVAVDWDHRAGDHSVAGSNITPLFGDFTKIEAHHVGSIDLLVGGTPCQSFSVAGKRLGLDDPRGNLTLEFLALAGRLRPRWLVWENVPGVLSDDEGRTFGTILGIMGKLGYGWAYRVLDAQYVRVDGFSRAVPQRRRRLFIVGHLGDPACAATVLFDRESLQGHPAPRRQAREATAPCSSNCTGSCCSGLTVAARLVAFGEYEDDGTASTAQARDWKGATDLVAVSTAFRTSPNCGAWETGDRTAAHTTGTDPSAHVIAIQERAVSENPAAGPQGKGWQEGIAYTLEARHHVQAVASGPQGVGHPAWSVRRLTPRECERLQGFPDNFTSIPWRGKQAADGPRYKAIGNSMAVNVMRWIGTRIDLVERIRVATAESESI